MASCIGEPGVGGNAGELIKIAIVDDDENDRSLMKRAVDRSRGLECVGVYNGGVEALNGIPSSESEVVLMDVRMPDMSGIDCTRRLKDIRPRLVITLITGLDHPDNAGQAREAGADAYLIKPLSLCLLSETLAVCFRRPQLGLNETHAPRTRQGLSAEEPTVRRALELLVASMETNPHNREDLVQEAWIYFWSSEHLHSERTLCWHLRGVRFHLQNLMGSGRSLDSSKRSRAQAFFPAHGDEWDDWRDSLEFDEGFLSAVSARDIVSLLADRLNSRDRIILRELAEGQRPCEIAAKLNVSHAFVVQRRRQIAKRAIKLGINPLPGGPFRRGWL
jgi:DNA-binding NarL/FixJ family response regulator